MMASSIDKIKGWDENIYLDLCYIVLDTENQYMQNMLYCLANLAEHATVKCVDRATTLSFSYELRKRWTPLSMWSFCLEKVK